MFDIATAITYYITQEEFKDAEMEIFKSEFDHEPETKMITLVVDNGNKIFKYFYYPKEEHNKWYFVVV